MFDRFWRSFGRRVQQSVFGRNTEEGNQVRVYFVCNDRFDIFVGAGSAGCEAITSELNDRIIKHFQSFCAKSKQEKKETRSSTVQPKSSMEKNEQVVYSL